MPDNVIPLGNITKLDVPVDRVCDKAKEKLEGGAVILGWDAEGDVFFASSIADGGEVLWLLEKCKQALLDAEVG